MIMEEKDYLKLAKEYSLKEWNFDIVLPAGDEDGWHYFSCDRAGRPKYSNMPVALRINNKREIEEILSKPIAREIYLEAHRLRLSKS